MNKKLLIPAAALLSVLGFTSTALAHNQTITPSCTGLTFSAVNYEGGGTNNVVTIKANDGTTFHTRTAPFGSSTTQSIVWANTSTWAWTVDIDANINNGNATQFDKHFSGTWQACQTAPTTTVAATTSTQPATTTTVNQTTTTVNQATTTQPDPTTSTVVAVDIPPVPTTMSPTIGLGDDSSLEPALPRTGTESNLGYISAVIILSGFGLVAIAGVKRRHPQ